MTLVWSTAKEASASHPPVRTSSSMPLIGQPLKNCTINIAALHPSIAAFVIAHIVLDEYV